MGEDNRDGERRRIAGESRKSLKGSKKRFEEDRVKGATPRQKRRKYGEIPRAQGAIQEEHQPSLPVESMEEDEGEQNTNQSQMEHPAMESPMDGEHCSPNLGIGEQEIRTRQLLPPPITTTNAGEDGGRGYDTTATQTLSD